MSAMNAAVDGNLVRRERLASYDFEIVTLFGYGTKAVLKKRSDGSCIYLTESGCSIWDRAPLVCRTFDCRLAYRSLTRAEQRRMIHGTAAKAVFEAGRALISLEDKSNG